MKTKGTKQFNYGRGNSHPLPMPATKSPTCKVKGCKRPKLKGSSRCYLHADDPRKSVIYFVMAAGSGYVKIGITENLASRLTGMQTDNPHKIILLAAIPGDLALEQMLHDLFKDDQVRGEWFALTDAMVEFIDSCASKSRAAVINELIRRGVDITQINTVR